MKRPVSVVKDPDAPPFGISPLDRHQLGWTALLGVVVFVLNIRALRFLVWGAGRAPSDPIEKVFSHLSVLWAVPVLPAALGLVGMLLFRERTIGPELAGRVPDTDPVEVCFRIVSRGTNPDALQGTVAAVRLEMAAQPLFPYRIEVVTDLPVRLEECADLRSWVVPTRYRTPHGAQYKARALQYMLDVSDLPPESWIMHLDEESHPLGSMIRGIFAAVSEEEASGAHRIGQGAILYHQKLRTHPFLTLADMLRTGDDLGRFYLQHRLGFTLFGLHGSFILVRNSVEQRVGFDFGPEGSITEDAFWALREMAAGSRCRWVEGYLLEQSPHSVRDFVMQRRRWFAGMIRVVLYAEVQAWIRVPLALFTALWSVAWLSMAYTLANLFIGLRTAPMVSVLGDTSLSIYAVTYLVGLYVNLRERAPLSLARQAGLYAVLLLSLPVFGCLEAAGVLAGLLKPERGFHVVQK